MLNLFASVKYSIRKRKQVCDVIILRHLITNMAPLTTEERCLIKCLRLEKGLIAFQMMREFPSSKWKKTMLNYLITKIDKLVIRAKGGHDSEQHLN